MKASINKENWHMWEEVAEDEMVRNIWLEWTQNPKTKLTRSSEGRRLAWSWGLPEWDGSQ